MKRAPATTCLALALFLTAAGAMAQAPRPPVTWVAEVGAFGVEGEEVGFGGLESRFPALRWGIYPLLGVLANSEAGWHVRAGLGRDFPLGRRWMATVSSATGFYDPGRGPDLGHDLEFRSALDVAYRFRDDLRVGLTVAHLSNAGFGEDNPGVETLSLSVAWRR